ncbi:unnamed protein product [Penicillium glandicola]
MIAPKVESSSLPEETPFRVIIVGAGVAGLTLAHCLEKAQVDYVLLDKGVVAPPFGTTITLQPHGCRILHQLGMLQEVMESCSTMGRCYYRTQSGKCFLENDFFPIVKKYAGYDTRTMNRQLFLQILYNHLPDKSKILERHRVVDIIEEKAFARVILADGTEYIGDLVVGTDGVHSKVREIMWNNANKAIPHYISAIEKRSMVTTYNAIVAQCPPIPGLGPQDMHSISNDRFSFLLLCQPTFISFIVHCKLPQDQQCAWPNRARFTEEDMEVLARKLADYPICESVVFGEMWRTRTKAQMISLEEGVLDHWCFGRTVMAGDAIHKVTPNSALGGCTAMEDVVTITNNLQELLSRHPNKKPTSVEINAAMQSYQDSRLERVKMIVKVGGDLTRLQAYDGWYFYIKQRWLTPWIGLDKLAIDIAMLCSTGPKLNFVDFPEQRGLLGWQDTIAAEAKKEHEAMKGTALQPRRSARWHWNGEVQSLWPLLVGFFLCFTSTLLWILPGDASHALPGLDIVS